MYKGKETFFLFITVVITVLIYSYSKTLMVSEKNSDKNKDYVFSKQSSVKYTQTLTEEKTHIKKAKTITQAGDFLIDAVLSPLIRNQSLIEADKLFYRHLSNLSGTCLKQLRFGTAGDGGYAICMDEPWAPKKNNCLVYDFGIRNEWSFVDDLHDRQGCEVHAFDPSMNVNDHIRKRKIFFHKLGIWNKNITNNQGWKLASLSDIIKYLSHEKRVIDILKIDVEGSEWSALSTMLQDHSTTNIKQLVFEMHGTKTVVYDKTPLTVSDYAQIYTLMSDLQQKLGFRLWRKNNINFCCPFFAKITSKDVAGPNSKDICCYELFYTNSLFVK